MKNEALAIAGWIIGVQGALGAGGHLWGEEPWGLIHRYQELSLPAYVVLLLVGAALAGVGESGKKRRKR
ncbi:hypothetical protein ABZ714_08000 [Streptomyces sp. NPDC006798]|uniref:hypothetical protein n=1 Tax=Streptomyces sp. NPDC006798 TaxID=3155462 RepID=UPI0033FC1B5F